MSVKTYLQDQIRLVSLSGYDLFTDEEYELYMQIVELGKEIDKLFEEDASDETKRPLLDKKKELKTQLEALIKKHDGTPRTVRLRSVMWSENGNVPAGVTWYGLKTSKRIAEFSCELSRAMGLKTDEATLDLIVIHWKNLDELHQLVVDGFYMPILQDDGTVENRMYHLFSSSAGQLRRDKIFCRSDACWEKVKNRIQAGMTWDWINKRGSLNVNKYMAYLSLCNSATEEWPEFDIDRSIVIKEFEGDVTGRMMYIKPDYTYETGIRTVTIDHTDGCGMMLPEVSMSNFMVRAAGFKGLLCSFDYMKFCRVRNAVPVIEDVWGQVHDLEKEKINVIFTSSMFKLYKLFRSWDEYKQMFKSNKCTFNKTNYEEDYIPNTYWNYQMCQTLTDFTDEEIKRFTAREHERIKNVSKDKDSMLKVLGAEKDAESPYRAALFYYPEMLREAYSRESLKSIRKKMLQDAKSGKIKCLNKRLYVTPDFFAACQFWFEHNEHPEGLVNNGDVACKIFRKYDKVDVLRSPHLYMEHCVRNVIHDPNVYEWFYTNAIVTSCHDLISRVLQFDCDGDQLNVVADQLVVEIAERNVREFDVIPLFYDANKADPDPITWENLFKGLKRAHDYSGIGEVSNMLTRLWNKDNPDRIAAAFLTRYNNDVIDGAKAGQIIHYKEFPKVARRIGKATGGKNARMPAFFEWSKNFRHNSSKKKKKEFEKPNNSTMNRICKAFDDIGNINLNYAGVAPFNWQMLMEKPCVDSRPEIPLLFCDMDSRNAANIIESQDQSYYSERQKQNGIRMTAEDITRVFTEKYGSLENAYPYVAKYLFGGEGINRSSHKQMFWNVFGEIALRNLKNNIKDCNVCLDCGMRYPSWVTKHVCMKNSPGFYECIDCGKMCERVNSKQCRCSECQDKQKNEKKRLRQLNYRIMLKENEEQRIGRLGLSSDET